MYLLLILFFASLFAIIFMLGKKLVSIKNGDSVIVEEITIEFLNLKEWKHSSIQNIKKYGFIGLVSTLRFYFKSKNIIKSKYQELRKKLKKLYRKEKEIVNIERKAEASQFLQMVSKYKQKIRKIKHQIHEEESL